MRSLSEKSISLCYKTLLQRFIKMDSIMQAFVQRYLFKFLLASIFWPQKTWLRAMQQLHWNFNLKYPISLITKNYILYSIILYFV